MTTTTPIRLLVVDDHPLMRVGICAMIQSQADMTVVAEASTVEEAIELYNKHLPDLTLIDLKLSDRSGIEVIRQIHALQPRARFVVLTNFEGDEDIHQALAAGAQGYIVKGMSSEIVLSAVRRVSRGGRFLPEPIVQTLQSRPPDSDLTAREHQVLTLVVEGKSNREIGEALGIAEATVKRHIGAILVRMEVNDRTQAVVAALRRGLIRL